ncbi:MAG TPA: phosphotransferase [Ktedonobacteraceae bacterium]
MNEDTHLVSATKAIAGRILSETFGEPVYLGEGSDLGGSNRSLVLRFPMQGGPEAAPGSVIVKRAVSANFDPDISNEPAWLLFNDWASLQFLGEIAASEHFAPIFYGGDRSAGLFVMEDLGDGTRLDHLLLGHDPEAAESGLMAYASMHGRLHALSMAKREEFLRIREALGPTTPFPVEYYSYGWLKPALHMLAERLNEPVQPAVDDELEALKDMLVHPGPFLGFMQDDACPDNRMLVGDNWRMIDFEGAHYGHVLLEGTCCRMPMPTCWCVYRLPQRIMQQAEATYRAELAKGCPEAMNEEMFAQGVVGASVAWALGFHQFMRPLGKMLHEDRTLAALSDRQRYLLYLNNAALSSIELHVMPAIGAILLALTRKLSELWPEAVEPPYYPAFR